MGQINRSTERISRLEQNWRYENTKAWWAEIIVKTSAYTAHCHRKKCINTYSVYSGVVTGVRGVRAAPGGTC